MSSSLSTSFFVIIIIYDNGSVCMWKNWMNRWQRHNKSKKQFGIFTEQFSDFLSCSFTAFEFLCLCGIESKQLYAMKHLQQNTYEEFCNCIDVSVEMYAPFLDCRNSALHRCTPVDATASTIPIYNIHFYSMVNFLFLLLNCVQVCVAHMTSYLYMCTHFVWLVMFACCICTRISLSVCQ